jgi:hypothetical protein
MKGCVVVSSSFNGLTPRWASAQDGLVEVTPTIVETRQIATIALIQSNHSNRTQENGVSHLQGSVGVSNQKSQRLRSYG